MRALLAALAVSAAYPGLWAVLAPSSCFEDFPGASRHWTSGLPSYSAHLVTDAGAFYLAFALLLGWAAVRPSRAFATVDAVLQTASLAAVLVASLAAVVVAAHGEAC